MKSLYRVKCANSLLSCAASKPRTTPSAASTFSVPDRLRTMASWLVPAAETLAVMPNSPLANGVSAQSLSALSTEALASVTSSFSAGTS